MYKDVIFLSEENVEEYNALIYQICSTMKYILRYFLFVGLCLASEDQEGVPICNRLHNAIN